MSFVRIHQPRSGKTFEGWKIPECGEDPPPGMVDWLGEFPADEWEGDDGGIIIQHTSHGDSWSETGWPGDYVVVDPEPRRLRIIRSRLVGETEEFQLVT